MCGLKMFQSKFIRALLLSKLLARKRNNNWKSLHNFSRNWPSNNVPAYISPLHMHNGTESRVRVQSRTQIRNRATTYSTWWKWNRKVNGKTVTSRKCGRDCAVFVRAMCGNSASEFDGHPIRVTGSAHWVQVDQFVLTSAPTLWTGLTPLPAVRWAFTPNWSLWTSCMCCRYLNK